MIKLALVALHCEVRQQRAVRPDLLRRTFPPEQHPPQPSFDVHQPGYISIIFDDRSKNIGHLVTE